MGLDLRTIANSAIQPINQDIDVEVWASTGYVIGAGLKQVPSYAPPLACKAQIQALSNDDLKQIDGLNISGVSKAIYIKGDLRGIVKPDSLGGDLVKWGGKTWLVTKVMESWPQWTKCILTYQGTA